MIDDIETLGASARDRLTATCDDLARLAHRMNNPLTTVLGRAQLLQMMAGGDEKVTRAAKAIEDSAVRLASLVQELGELVGAAREGLATTVPVADTDVEP